MPTPFYHIWIAEDLLHQAGLPEPVYRLLTAQRGPFLFGNTAPDVQVVSGQERRATHFFSLPIQPDSLLPWELLLREYPILASPATLAPDYAAFLAGYLCHLADDWFWITDIFTPVFGPSRGWSDFKTRLYLHNVLRSYLDRIILHRLPEKLAEDLATVKPRRWLPFVNDAHLVEWRDVLARQLQPGAAAETVEVFATRQGINPADFYNLLNSEAQMEAEVFQHISRRNLEIYRERVLDVSLNLLLEYFSSHTSRSQSIFTGLGLLPGP